MSPESAAHMQTCDDVRSDAIGNQDSDDVLALYDVNHDMKITKNEFTSALTNKIILAIFNTNTCDLPTLKQSSHLHYELFRIFNAHIEKLTGVKPALCPIT